MADLIRTERTYKTRENAVKALENALSRSADPSHNTLDAARWLIAVNADGRFAPVLVGAEYVPFIHIGITVVG